MSVSLATWSLANPKPAILLFAMACLVGFWGLAQLHTQYVPDLQLPTVNIELSQPGAARDRSGPEGRGCDRESVRDPAHRNAGGRRHGPRERQVRDRQKPVRCTDRGQGRGRSHPPAASGATGFASRIGPRWHSTIRWSRGRWCCPMGEASSSTRLRPCATWMPTERRPRCSTVAPWSASTSTAPSGRTSWRSTSGYINIGVELPPGSSLKTTSAATESSRIALAHIDGITHVLTTVGDGDGDRDAAGDVRHGGLTIVLTARDRRPGKSAIQAEIQRALDRIPATRFSSAPATTTNAWS